MVKFESKMLDVIEALHKSVLLNNCIISSSLAMLFLKKTSINNYRGFFFLLISCILNLTNILKMKNHFPVFSFWRQYGK